MQHAETAGAFENSRKAAVSGDAARFLLFSGAVRVVVGGAGVRGCAAQQAQSVWSREQAHAPSLNRLCSPAPLNRLNRLGRVSKLPDQASIACVRGCAAQQAQSAWSGEQAPRPSLNRLWRVGITRTTYPHSVDDTPTTSRVERSRGPRYIVITRRFRRGLPMPAAQPKSARLRA